MPRLLLVSVLLASLAAVPVLAKENDKNSEAGGRGNENGGGKGRDDAGGEGRGHGSGRDTSSGGAGAGSPGAPGTGGSSGGAPGSAPGAGGAGGSGGGGGGTGSSGGPAPGVGSTGTIIDLNPSQLGVVQPGVTGSVLMRFQERGDTEPDLPSSLMLSARTVFVALRRMESIEPLQAQPGTSADMVRTCRNSVVRASRPYGAVRVDAASAGPTRRMRNGAFAAPIEVRVVYENEGRIQIRQSTATCHLNGSREVVALR